ncbi:hypothetical protein BH18ACT15_BH18ACT15_03310 [soil metagenome]
MPLPSLPKLPARFSVRRPRLDEAGVVADVMRAAETARGLAPETTAEDVRIWWRELDTGESAWLIADDRGRVLAYADLMRRTDEDYVADGYVHPTSRAVASAAIW